MHCKSCSNCGGVKPLDQYCASAKARDGRASWCKPCTNAKKRTYSREQRRKWALKALYGLTVKDYNEKLAAQNGVCEICKSDMKRPVVDHDHDTGVMRGILCHRCNVRLSGWEEKQWHAAAMQYLERWK